MVNNLLAGCKRAVRRTLISFATIHFAVCDTDDCSG